MAEVKPVRQPMYAFHVSLDWGLSSLSAQTVNQVTFVAPTLKGKSILEGFDSG